MIINDRAWTRLVAPIHAYSSVEFLEKLYAMYGFKDVTAETLFINSDWRVTFVSENARIMFMLKWGHLL